MESSAPQPDERGAPEGRVAVPEIAELLHLQRPAALVAAAVVVLVGLAVAFFAPDLLPPNPFTGLAVGLLALLAAVTAAVVLDGRDPILRGPRHLRRDGHTVLARMAGPDPVEHSGAVVAALERRLAERDHLSIALTGSGTDPSRLAEAVGRAAAADGHTSLVIDLRSPSAPGVADVGAGTVRLGEAAQLAGDRPYAWIGTGTDRSQAVPAAATVARRPPRDLALLLIVAPEAATHAPDLLQACDRTVLLVAADSQQRAMVSARLEALVRAGGRPEAIVVGGLQVAGADVGDADASAVDTARRTPGGPFARDREAAVEPAGDAPATPAASSSVPAPPATPVPPIPSRAADVDAPASSAPADEPAADATRDALGRPYTQVAGGDDATGAVRIVYGPPAAADGTDEPDEPDELEEFEADDADEPSASAAVADAPQEDLEPTAAGTDGPDDDGPDDDELEVDEPEPLGADEPEPIEDAAPSAETAPAAGEDPDAAVDEPPPAAPGLDDTGPMAPVTFRDAGPEGDEPDEGFAPSDPMVTAAALEQLRREQDDED